MPSKRTTNYQLCQWEPEDQVVHTDFNEDNFKIDAAIAEEVSARTAAVAAVQNTLSALQTKVEGKQDASVALKLKVGCYAGNTTHTPSSSKITGSQTISVGFRPKAVLVIPENGGLYSSSGSGHVFGGLALADCPGSLYSRTTLEITSSGFKVYTYANSSDYYSIQLNDTGTNYHYIALG